MQSTLATLFFPFAKNTNFSSFTVHTAHKEATYAVVLSGHCNFTG